MSMGSAFPRSAVPLLAAALLAAAASPLAQIVAAGGHPGTTAIRGTVTRIEDGVRFTITDERNGRQRLVRECAGPLCSGTWFDGDRLSTFGINGDTYPASPEASRNERTIAAVLELRFAEPDFDGTVAALGPHRFLVQADGGTPFTVRIDPASRLPIEASGPGGIPSLTFEPPQRIAGAAVLAAAPFDRLEAGPERLEPPGGPHIAFGPVIALGFNPATALAIVPCRLETLTLRCLFDTGSTPSSLTLPVAERLGREPQQTIVVHSFETYASGTIDAGPLTIGNATVVPLHFAVIPSTRDLGYDVIVGSDILDAMRVEVDAAKGLVRVMPPRAEAPGLAIPLSFDLGSPYVALTIAGEPEEALFDTGDPSLAAIGYDAYRKHPAFPASQAGDVSGVVGASDTLAGRADDVRIGPLVLGSAPVLVVRSRHTAHVGLGLAQRCAVLGIDLHEGRLDCTPR